MYYAYAISLMHHFKSLGPKHQHIEDIFNLLNIHGDDRDTLAGILAKPGFFSSADILKIEFILEPKLRELVAEKVITDFLRAPLNSSLYSDVAYEFKKQVKAKLLKKHQDIIAEIQGPEAQGLDPDDAQYIIAEIQVPDDEQSIAEFNEAEIYRVPGIRQAIDDYTTPLAEEIAKDEQVAAKIVLLKEVDPSDKRAKARAQELLGAIDNFFQKKIVDFFKDNEQKNLVDYLKRLTSSTSWGTKDSIDTLHAIITGNGPRFTEEGRWEDHTARPINFINFKNGRPAVLYTADKSLDIILDNWGNTHWVSQIPAKKDLQILLIDKPGDKTLTAILGLSDEIDTLLKDYLAKALPESITKATDKTQEKRLKTSLTMDTAALKEKLLTELLNQIQEGKPIDLEQNYAYQQLVKCKAVFQFITDDSHTQAEKIDCLKTYEGQAKSNPTGWEIFGQFIQSFLLSGLFTVIGTFVGAGVGGVLGSAAGPGGSIVGAIWGAFKGGNLAVLAGASSGVVFGSTLGILQMLQPTNPVQDYVAQAQRAVKNSLEYRVVKQSADKIEQQPVVLDVVEKGSEQVVEKDSKPLDGETPSSPITFSS